MAEFLTGAVSNEEASAFIRGKRIVDPSAFSQLGSELRALSFSVSGISDANVLQRIRDRIAEIPQGADWQEARKDVAKDLSPYFVDPDADKETQDKQISASYRRAELLLRTHGYQAYQAQQWRDMQATKNLLPYWKYITVGDDRVRDSHRALHGLILPADDPFWLDHFPPWDWGCRCQVIATTPEEYERAQRDPSRHRYTIGPEAARRLREDGLLDRGDGSPVRVATPKDRAAERGENPNGAYSFDPSVLALPIDEVTGSWDNETLDDFERWADGQALEGLVAGTLSLWQWLKSKRKARGDRGRARG